MGKLTKYQVNARSWKIHYELYLKNEKDMNRINTKRLFDGKLKILKFEYLQFDNGIEDPRQSEI